MDTTPENALTVLGVGGYFWVRHVGDRRKVDLMKPDGYPVHGKWARVFIAMKHAGALAQSQRNPLHWVSKEGA